MQLIGLSGSRYHAPAAILPVVKNCMLFAGPSVTWGIGCCPTGLDQTALQVAKTYHLPYIFFKAANRSASALRLRTIQLVHASTSVISFPCSPIIQYSGSWLAVAQAATSGKPVFVWLPAHYTAAQLPTWRNIVAWQRVPPAALPFPASGLAFWQPVVQSFQINLFNQGY
jgi:hypothetical protein